MGGRYIPRLLPDRRRGSVLIFTQRKKSDFSNNFQEVFNSLLDRTANAERLNYDRIHERAKIIKQF